MERIILSSKRIYHTNLLTPRKAKLVKGGFKKIVYNDIIYYMQSNEISNKYFLSTFYQYDEQYENCILICSFYGKVNYENVFEISIK